MVKKQRPSHATATMPTFDAAAAAAAAVAAAAFAGDPDVAAPGFAAENLHLPYSPETSPSPLSAAQVDEFLAHSPPKHAKPSDSSDVQLVCMTYKCFGFDHDFEVCEKRPFNGRIRHHGRGEVCVIHHRFIKCASCSHHIHEGCWVKSSTGYTQPKRDLPWTCIECTLQPQGTSKVKSENPNSEGDSKCTLPVASDALPLVTEVDESAKVRSHFKTRQLLLAHMREQGWKINNNEGHRMYFTCLKCSRRIKARAQSEDIENGDWLALNLPSSHDCVKYKPVPVATAMTTRVFHLSNAVFTEIQRLACSKAFNTVSIQTFIKSQYGTLVDTCLIYNIGYRARQKLGIAEMEKLIVQRDVCVYVTYTSPSSSKLTTMTGTKSAR
jgi:hypothetical protein